MCWALTIGFLGRDILERSRKVSLCPSFVVQPDFSSLPTLSNTFCQGSRVGPTALPFSLLVRHKHHSTFQLGHPKPWLCFNNNQNLNSLRIAGWLRWVVLVKSLARALYALPLSFTVSCFKWSGGSRRTHKFHPSSPRVGTEVDVLLCGPVAICYKFSPALEEWCPSELRNWQTQPLGLSN